jgi:hypothetical protein
MYDIILFGKRGKCKTRNVKNFRFLKDSAALYLRIRPVYNRSPERRVIYDWIANNT